VENLGDRWGRGLQYGEGLDEPDRAAVTTEAGSLTRAGFLAQVQSLSAVIDEFEQLGLKISRLHAASPTPDPTISETYRLACTVEDTIRVTLEQLLEQCDGMG